MTGLEVALPFLQSSLQYGQQQQNLQQQHFYNQQMSRMEFAQNYAMWQEMNKYNHPSSQMQRLKDAGLNPALMYGQTGAYGNTTSGAPRYNARGIDFSQRQAPDVLTKLNQYQNFKLGQAQTDNVQAQTELNNATTTLKMTENSIKYLDRQLKALDYEWRTSPHKGKPYKSNYFSYLDDRANLQLYRSRLVQTQMQVAESVVNRQLMYNRYQERLLKMQLRTGYFRAGAQGLGAAAGSALGLSRIGKASRLASPMIPKNLSRNNSDIRPNTNFYNPY